MTLSRRRFLTLSASFACAPAFAHANTWSGRAFGGDVSITLTGPRAVTAQAHAACKAALGRIERLFSLYDPLSDLVRLNTRGELLSPDPHFLSLMALAGDVVRSTGGLFDPTIQPLWQAHATGGDILRARSLIGWDRVQVTPDRIALAPGQALTFNGIAQGYATDVLSEILVQYGLSHVLVNIGEYRGIGGPWTLALEDPFAGALGHRTLTDHAIATSSPGAMSLAQAHHILHPDQDPLWSTVSVEAKTAALADALSTGLVFASRAQIADIVSDHPSVSRVTLVDRAGDLITL